MSFYSVVSMVSTLIVLLPLFVGALLYKHLQKLSKLMLLLVCLACVPQIIAAINKFYPLSWKSLSYNLYTPVEFALMMLFLYELNKRVVKEDVVFKRVRNGFALSVIAYFILAGYFFYNDNFSHFFIKKLVFFNNFLYTAWILFYFYQVLRFDSWSLDSRQSFFWHLTAYLIYSSMSALYFILTPYTYRSATILSEMGTIQNLSNILLYCLISVGFWKDYKLWTDGR